MKRKLYYATSLLVLLMTTHTSIKSGRVEKHTHTIVNNTGFAIQVGVIYNNVWCADKNFPIPSGERVIIENECFVEAVISTVITPHGNEQALGWYGKENRANRMWEVRKRTATEQDAGLPERKKFLFVVEKIG